MREIKFRAWDKRTKVMFLNVQDEYDGSVTGCDSFGQVMEYLDVMQYTWLKDSKWVEIYEGDIILISSCSRTFEVYFEAWEFRWRPHITNLYKWWWSDLWRLSIVDLHFVEVIGNIYENPTEVT